MYCGHGKPLHDTDSSPLLAAPLEQRHYAACCTFEWAHHTPFSISIAHSKLDLLTTTLAICKFIKSVCHALRRSTSFLHRPQLIRQRPERYWHLAMVQPCLMLSNKQALEMGTNTKSAFESFPSVNEIMALSCSLFHLAHVLCFCNLETWHGSCLVVDNVRGKKLRLDFDRVHKQPAPPRQVQRGRCEMPRQAARLTHL